MYEDHKQAQDEVNLCFEVLKRNAAKTSLKKNKINKMNQFACYYSSHTESVNFIVWAELSTLSTPKLNTMSSNCALLYYSHRAEQHDVMLTLQPCSYVLLLSFSYNCSYVKICVIDLLQYHFITEFVNSCFTADRKKYVS